MPRDVEANTIELVLQEHRYAYGDLPKSAMWLDYLSDSGLIVLVLCTMYAELHVLFPVAIAVFLLGSVYLEYLKRRSRHSGRDERLSLSPQEANETGRVVCSGGRRELGRVASLRAERFEPVLFFDERRGGLLEEFARGQSVPVVLGVVAVSMLLAFSGQVGPWPVAIVLVAGRWWSGWARARLRPLYYRIYPGRLEFLRFGVLASTPRSKRTWSLHESRVVCRFDKKTLEIIPLQEDQRYGARGTDLQREALTVDLARFAEPHALAGAVLVAAISPLSSIVPPENALVG